MVFFFWVISFSGSYTIYTLFSVIANVDAVGLLSRTMVTLVKLSPDSPGFSSGRRLSARLPHACQLRFMIRLELSPVLPRRAPGHCAFSSHACELDSRSRLDSPIPIRRKRLPGLWRFYTLNSLHSLWPFAMRFRVERPRS